MLQHRTTRCNKRQQRRPYDWEGNGQCWHWQHRHHVLVRATFHKPNRPCAQPSLPPCASNPLDAAPAFCLHVGKRTRLAIVILASFSSMPRALRILPVSVRPLPLPPVIIAAAAAPFPPAIALIIALSIVHINSCTRAPHRADANGRGAAESAWLIGWRVLAAAWTKQHRPWSV